MTATLTFAAPAAPAQPTFGAEHPFKAEIMEIIRWAATNAPRSTQQAIGPSEIGNPCLRKIAFKVGRTPAVNKIGDQWFSVIGTAVHAWLAEAIDRYQREVLGRGPDNPRYLIEQSVRLPMPGEDVIGSCDLFDRDVGRVEDHKIVGATSLKKYVDYGPSTTYRKQAHLYGYGWEVRGYTVREVVIAFYPRSSFLQHMHVWSEPYDRQVALDALSRLHTVRQLRQVLTPNLLPANGDRATCVYCPWFRPGVAADERGCPGA